VIKKLFPQAEWGGWSYSRATHRPCLKHNATNVEALFGVQFASKSFGFSVKSPYLTGVPPKERYFATSQEQKMFRNLCDDYDASTESFDGSGCCVAVKQIGKGKIGYFADVNGEFEVAALLVAFVGSAGLDVPEQE